MHEQVRRNSNNKSTTSGSFAPRTFSVQTKAKKGYQLNGDNSTLAPKRMPTGNSHQSQSVINHNASETKLKDAVTQLYGVNVSDVTVEYNSPKPAQFQAEAFAQGDKIYVQSGKEKHVAHELCHIAQQLQGRVKPTMQLEGVPLNDDPKLEREADEMGAKALAISQYNPGTKLGQELTPVVQSNNIGNTIQRAVGFEFQTNWGVQEKLPEKHWEKQKECPKFKRKSTRRPYNSRTVLRDFGGFQMTTDQADTNIRCEIEWVVDPIQESQGIEALYQVMTRLQNLVGSMIGLQQEEKFTLDRVTNNANDSSIEVYPNIKGSFQGVNMRANPQVTAGVLLDKISSMFAQLGEPRRGGPHPDPHANVQEELMGMGGAGILQSSAVAANNIPGQHSASFKGLAAQIIAYLKAGALDPILIGRRRQAFTYPKLIGKIMARTDFGSQFRLLPEAERQIFENSPQDFVDLILNAANVGDGNVNVFERRIQDLRTPDGMLDVPVTRNEWLINIVQGQDRLTRQFHEGYVGQQLEGLGEFGSRVDLVTPNNFRAPILEFRQVREQMPYTEWLPFAGHVFEYLRDLNQS